MMIQKVEIMRWKVEITRKKVEIIREKIETIQWIIGWFKSSTELLQQISIILQVQTVCLLVILDLQPRQIQNITSAVCLQSNDSFFFLFISVLSDRLPWQGPWGSQPWRFSGPPPGHHFGHWGVKADQPGTLNQAVNHLPHGAPGQLHSIPTVSLWLQSTKRTFLIFISEAIRKWVTRNLGRRYISCHELILQISIAVVDA